MEEIKVNQQIESINKKLDVILEEIELQRRHRREMEDLKDDLLRVGKDIYDTAIVELEQVHDQVSTKEILHLGKYLLRNVSTINRSVEQLESLKDFLTDVSPLVRESIMDFMQKLDEYDKKGYFEFAKELSNVTDNIVTSFSKEDVKNLGDNIVTILNTVKNLTQPDMLHTINNALNVYKQLDIVVSKDVSIFKLMKELNTPEVKRGLGFAIQFLKNIANPETNNHMENKPLNKSIN
ncbi:MAG: hypothetical protein CVV24_04185 [Ignavibacteriae bacterium HGW-Ignavibacteriae-3]|nr:MAG: hypothetical protein CVV24_04185 [Ignavibacteriae bacterium HGW-Ignavibacteriae-3]